VYLHGTVDDQAVRSEVEQLASSVRGVGQIHNELDVR
jgi:osmotically-inducible protein OsmY